MVPQEIATLMISKIITFGFPFFLVLLEGILRKALNLDTHAFLGPTLAAVGIGFTIQLTNMKEITSTFRPSTQQVIRNARAVTYLRKDMHFVGVACIILILMVSGWYCCLYYSVTSPLKVIYSVPIPLGLGILIYIVGVVLSVIKDKISCPKDKL